MPDYSASAQSAEELAARYFHSRDPAVRNALIESQLYIAKIVAKKFSNRGVEYDDLLQVASMALLKASERYDPAYGVKFASFVTPSMIGEVKNYFRDRSRLIRLPRNASELLVRMEHAQETLTIELMRSPTAVELAEKMGISLEDTIELMEMRTSSQVQSLDSVAEDEDDEAPVGFYLGEEDGNLAGFEDSDMLQRAMEHLSPREQEVVKLRFYRNLSQRQTADALGVSQMTISRIERRALEILRNALDETGDKIS